MVCFTQGLCKTSCTKPSIRSNSVLFCVTLVLWQVWFSKSIIFSVLFFFIYLKQHYAPTATNIDMTITFSINACILKL